MNQPITRRSALKLGAIATAAELFPFTLSGQTEPKTQTFSTLLDRPLDYTKAKATPTICFGCTNHCSVVGWVQDLSLIHI